MKLFNPLNFENNVFTFDNDTVYYTMNEHIKVDFYITAAMICRHCTWEAPDRHDNGPGNWPTNIFLNPTKSKVIIWAIKCIEPYGTEIERTLSMQQRVCFSKVPLQFR